MTTTTSIVQEIASGAGGLLTPVYGATYTLSPSAPHLLLFGPLGIPANAVIHSAQLTLCPASTVPGNDTTALLAWDGSIELSESDLDAPVVDPTRSGAAAANNTYTLDFTDQVASAVQAPGWHEYAALKFLQTRTTSSGRRYHTPFGDSDNPPKLEITWSPAPDPDPDPDPDPEPEQTYRIVGPAGLENVRLIGVTDEGGITTLRLTGEWNGTTVTPLA